MIRLCSKYTVARMLERDDFAKRYKEGMPISIHELHLSAGPGLRFGGSRVRRRDGRYRPEAQSAGGPRTADSDYGQLPQIVATVPILEGLDGVNKMSKSLGNYIGITEAPEVMFRKVMQVSR